MRMRMAGNLTSWFTFKEIFTQGIHCRMLAYFTCSLKSFHCFINYKFIFKFFQISKILFFSLYQHIKEILLSNQRAFKIQTSNKSFQKALLSFDLLHLEQSFYQFCNKFIFILMSSRRS